MSTKPNFTGGIKDWFLPSRYYISLFLSHCCHCIRNYGVGAQIRALGRKEGKSARSLRVRTVDNFSLVTYMGALVLDTASTLHTVSP